MSDAVSAVDFVLSVKTNGSYETLAEQTSTGLLRSLDEADATSKDSLQWHEGLPVIRNWSFECEANLIEDDAALLALEDDYDNLTLADVRITTPAANTYTGQATVETLDMDGPHDGIVSVSIVLKGSGALVKAP